MTHAQTIESSEIILREATRLFVEQGFHGISMREIAESVGMSKAGLYYHFKDKEALLLAVLTANIKSIDRAINDARRQGKNTRQKIHLMVKAIFEQAPEQRAIIRLVSQVLGHLNPQARTEFGEIYHDLLLGPIETVLQEGIVNREIEAVDTNLATWILLGMAYPFFYSDHQLSQYPSDEAVEMMVRVFFDGLTPDSAGLGT